jgi:signal peptidase I
LAPSASEAPERSKEELFQEVSFRRAFPRNKELTPKHKPFWRELPVLIIIAFAVALLLKSFVLQAFFIPSASMEETLQIGDRVLVEKVSYRWGSPGHGDVVVFEKDLDPSAQAKPDDDPSLGEKVTDAFKGLFGFPTGDSQDFIKRVIGVAGDVVEGRNGRVFVDGKRIDEPYLQPGMQTSDFGPVKVPESQIFVMGDNRTNSADSREFGPVPVDKVVGRAFLLIWPPTDFHTL